MQTHDWALTCPLPVGACDGQKEDQNSTIFRNFLNHHWMFAANTFEHCGPTYFSACGGQSRIDCSCLPQSLRTHVACVRVMHKVGNLPQYSKHRSRLDHRPVGWCLIIGLNIAVRQRLLNTILMLWV